MGIEQSTMMHADTGAPSVPTTKPNKIKRYNHFHSKPSHVIDLIANRDWQKLLAAIKTHQREIFLPQKVRLFGVDRKVLPIHLACAMSPPTEVIEGLLNADTSLTTVKTPMKNCKKKARNIPFTGGVNLTKSSSFRKLDVQTRRERTGSNGIEIDDGDIHPSLLTPATEPLSSFDAGEFINDELLHTTSFESLNKATSTQNNFFFPEHKQDYALQITPSGDVRQISPNGSYCNSSNDTESPFVYLSQPEDVNPSNLANIADDFLPLHIACLFKASASVVNLLIEAYPEAVEYKNKWGMLPIHIVCANVSMETPKIASKKPVDDFTAKRYLNNLYAVTISDEDDTWEINKIINRLVDAYPPSLTISSDNVEWLTPIEYVGKNFPSGQEREELLNLLKRKRTMITEQLMDQDPNMIRGASNKPGCREANQRTMLYSYLKMKDWDNANQQIQQCPDEVSCWVMDKEYDSLGSSHLPIHLACSNDAPADLIYLLSNTYPEGIKAKGKDGFNPLHIACKKSLREDTILHFVNKCPQAASQKDEYGRIPLHLACKSNLSLSIVEALIQAYPESCTVKDYNGHTALTYYCSDNERNLSHEKANILFERYGGLTTRNDELKDGDVTS